MRDDPGLDLEEIAASLKAHYDVSATAITFLPLGYDLSAAVYEVVAADGAAYFLKIRSGPVNEASLEVPRALQACGIPNILAPLPARTGALWSRLAGHDRLSVVLYPFIRGESAMISGLTASQWRELGATLRAVHDSGLEARFRGRVRTDDFSLPSARLVRQVLGAVAEGRWEEGVAARFAAFWRERAGEIRTLLARAEELGARLRIRPFTRVLCHADIHAANILVDEVGRIHLVDWDGPLIAPRERDLLFVVGSRIARAVEPWEEEHFFQGYGPVAIHREALVYYRYERVIEDIGEFGKSVLLDPGRSEEARASDAALMMGFFAPGGMLASIERVVLHQPGASA